MAIDWPSAALSGGDRQSPSIQSSRCRYDTSSREYAYVQNVDHRHKSTMTLHVSRCQEEGSHWSGIPLEEQGFVQYHMMDRGWNTNCVDMFSSLRASSIYNPILITFVNLLLFYDTQVQITHIPGNQNTVADALSRFANHSARWYQPNLLISPFQPPRLSLGATLS